MNYVDYPILDENAYKFLQEKYKEVLPFDRRTMINKIYLDLKECLSYCYGIKNVNKKIALAVDYAKCEILKLLENFDLTFSINLQSNKEFKNFNIFALLKNLIDTTKKYQNWLKFETKDYHKQFAINNINAMLDIINTLVQALENSNIILFKHM